MATYGTSSGNTRMLASNTGIPTFIAGTDTVNWDLADVTYTLTNSFVIDGGAINLDPTSTFTLDMDSGQVATFTVSDNLTSAFLVQEASTAYLDVTTSNGSEVITFGNGTTNPDFTFTGAGTATFAGDVKLTADSTTLAVGASDDWSVSHDGTDTLMTSTTGDLTIDNTSATGATIMLLGTDTTATEFEVQNNSTNALFTVSGNGDVAIPGNLTVSGTTTTVSSQDLLVTDNHIELNAAYVGAPALAGCVVIIQNSTGTADTVASGGFTAGVPATTDSTVATTGAATFSAGDLVQITDANDADNNGIFEVQAHAANVMTIKGQLTSIDASAGFAKDDFTTDAVVAGAITEVNLNIIQAGTDGLWEVTTAAVNSTPITYNDLATVTGQTLQLAYVAGNTITTSGGEGDVTIQGTEDFIVGGSVDVTFSTTGAFNQSGGGQVDFTGNVDASAGLDIDADNQSLTIGAGADLTIVHDATDTTMTSTTGDLIIDNTLVTGSTIVRLGTTTSATDFQVQSVTPAALFTVDGSGQADFVGNVDASGGLDVDADSVSLTVGAGADWSVSHNGTDTLMTSTTGDFTLDNQFTTGSTIMVLGTDDGNTDFQIQNNSVAALFTVLGSGQATFSVADNTADSFLVQEGANAYIDVTTTDASEAINLGNATTNPTLTQLGTGQVTFGGNVDAPLGVDITADNTALSIGASADFSVAHDGNNTVMANDTGNFTLDNTDATGATVMLLGTNTTATRFEVQSDDTTALMTILGSGQVDFSGNVDANLGLDVSGADLTATGGDFVFTGVNVNLDPTGTYDLAMDAAQTMTFHIADNLASAFDVLEDGAGSYIEINTTNSQEIVIIGADSVSSSVAIQGGVLGLVSTEAINSSLGFIYQNNGYTTVAAKNGGLVVNFLPTAVSSDVTAWGTGTITVTSAASFAATDYIQVDGSIKNDGLYRIESIATNTISIIDAADAADDEDMLRLSVDTGDVTGGSVIVTKVGVSAIRAGDDGVWEQGTGNQGPISFADLATAAGTTLQTAYDAGNTIILSDTSGDMLITLDEVATEADFRITGVGDYLETDAANNQIILGSSSVAVLLEDSTLLEFGTGSDATMRWDGTDMDVLAAADDQVWNWGTGTNSWDMVWFGNTASDSMTFDASANTMTLNGVDFRLLDSDILEFGDSQDVSMRWDGTDMDVLALADSQWVWGDGTNNWDMLWFGNTVSETMSLDTANNLLTLDGLDFQLLDSDSLQFGDAQDVSMAWDGTDMDVTVLTDNSVWNWGVAGGNVIDMVWHGAASGDEITLDVSANTMTFDAIDINMGDADRIRFGDSLNVAFHYDGSVTNDLRITGLVGQTAGDNGAGVVWALGAGAAASGATAGASGGDFTLNSGAGGAADTTDAGGSAGSGSDFSFTAGTGGLGATGTNDHNGGSGGSVGINGGTGGTGASSATTVTNGGIGGATTNRSGNGGTGGEDTGATGGVGGTGGNAGNYLLTAGQGGTGGSSDGASGSNTGGVGGTGAAFVIAGGQGGTGGSANGAGGSDTGGAGGSGGDLTLRAGVGGTGSTDADSSGSDGVDGDVLIGTANTAAITLGTSGVGTTVAGGIDITNAFSGTAGLLMSNLDLGSNADPIGNIFQASYIQQVEGSDPAAPDATKGILYMKTDANDTQLWFINNSESAQQITGLGSDTVDLNEAYQNGRTITHDQGPIVFDHSSVDGILELQPGLIGAVLPAIQVDFTDLDYTGTPSGLDIDYSAVTDISHTGDFFGMRVSFDTVAISGANDVSGLDLLGATNSGGGSSTGIAISGWDFGIVMAPSETINFGVSSPISIKFDPVTTGDITAVDNLYIKGGTDQGVISQLPFVIADDGLTPLALTDNILRDVGIAVLVESGTNGFANADDDEFVAYVCSVDNSAGTAFTAGTSPSFDGFRVTTLAANASDTRGDYTAFGASAPTPNGSSGTTFTGLDLGGSYTTAINIRDSNTTGINIGTGHTTSILSASGEILVSGGNVQLNDSITQSWGTGDDLTLVHDGTDTTFENDTGIFNINNTSGSNINIDAQGGDLILEVNDGSEIGVQMGIVSGVGTTAGRVLAIDTSGELEDATNVTATALYNVVAVAINSPGAAGEVQWALPGTVCGTTDLAGFTAGDVLYLGTAGAVTNVAPSGSGTSVVRVGIVTDVASDQMIFMPQFIANNP